MSFSSAIKGHTNYLILHLSNLIQWQRICSIDSSSSTSPHSLQKSKALTSYFIFIFPTMQWPVIPPITLFRHLFSKLRSKFDLALSRASHIALETLQWVLFFQLWSQISKTDPCLASLASDGSKRQKNSTRMVGND